MRALVPIALFAVVGCGGDEPAEEDSETDATTAGPTSKGDNPLTTASESTAADTTVSGAQDADSSSSSSGTSDGESTTTGALTCDKRVVLMGYWPPTNEMLRPWSPNLEQNPDGWIGEDWGGHGYDVFAFFPEFPPDGDPTNDEIGQDGAVGSPAFDLRVDYQATSADFWRIVDEQQPVIVVTTSRGGAIGWEVEAFEGGHGLENAGDPSLDWTSDGHGLDTHPTQATIDARSWDAIFTHRQGARLPTALPVQAIVDATTALALTDVVVDDGTSGNFLSGFLGLHGLYWQLHTPNALAAGHIHVGFGMPVETASTLVETTLHAILQEHPADLVPCP
jgi:hypothetical protein